MKAVHPSQLKLGDIVRLDTEAFSDAIVCQIGDERIHFFRPYAVHADFSHTGGVICYTGIEQFSISKNSAMILLARESVLAEGEARCAKEHEERMRMANALEQISRLTDAATMRSIAESAKLRLT